MAGPGTRLSNTSKLDSGDQNDDLDGQRQRIPAQCFERPQNPLLRQTEQDDSLCAFLAALVLGKLSVVCLSLSDVRIVEQSETGNLLPTPAGTVRRTEQHGHPGAPERAELYRSSRMLAIAQHSLADTMDADLEKVTASVTPLAQKLLSCLPGLRLKWRAGEEQVCVLMKYIYLQVSHLLLCHRHSDVPSSRNNKHSLLFSIFWI